MLRWQGQLSRSQQLCLVLLALLLVGFHTEHLLRPPALTPSPLPLPLLPSAFAPPRIQGPTLDQWPTTAPLLSPPKPAGVPPPGVPPGAPPGVPGRGNAQWALSAPSVAGPDATGAAPGLVPLAWVPRPNRYLLLLCFRGQVSNIVRCLRNSVLAAGLLNRTLLVPRYIPYQKDPSLVWDLRLLWDLTASQGCLGEGTLMALDEYLARQGSQAPLGIDLIACWGGPRGMCGERDDGLSHSCPGRRGSRGRGRGRGKRDARGSTRDILRAYKASPAAREILALPQYWSSEYQGLNVTSDTVAVALCLPRTAGLREFLAAFESEAPVLSLGDLVLPPVAAIAAAAAGYKTSKNPTPIPAPLRSGQQNGVLQDSSATGEGPSSLADFFRGDHPFAGQPGKCTSRLAIHPVARFLEASESMARSVSGGRRFACVHWRRGDFAAFCGRDKELRGHCTYGAEQAASCLVAALGSPRQRPGSGPPLNISRIFLATNAAKKEVRAHFIAAQE